MKDALPCCVWCFFLCCDLNVLVPAFISPPTPPYLLNTLKLGGGKTQAKDALEANHWVCLLWKTKVKQENVVLISAMCRSGCLHRMYVACNQLRQE